MLVLAGTVGAVGVGVAMMVGVAQGMDAPELTDLLLALLPLTIAVVAITPVAAPALARTSMRARFVVISLLSATIALVFVWLLSMQMFVSEHDAAVLTVLVVAGAGAGLAAALVVARSSGAALESLGRTAERLGGGDLGARAGELGAGPELDALARTLDRMAEDLQAALARERDAEAMRRDLITTVSHDLRTPLSSVRAMAEAIDDGVVDDRETVRRYAAELRRSTAQLVTLVDDLFELTQLDAGAIEAETSRVALEEAARTALATVELQAAEKGLALETDLGRAGEAWVSPRLARVLQNLLVNAVRHTPADGTVRLTADRDGEGLHVAVEDSGEGIGAADMDRVFEPFYRADPARSGPGAGLGLALAKRIVEALGGDIRAENAPGAGARFALDLPATAARSDRSPV
jgi:signal transduction histidine kinase